MQGDAVARNVVDGAAQHLDEGGFAHVLCNWVVPPGADWQEPPLQWTEGSGCDVLVIRYDRGLLDDVYALVEGHRIRQCLTYRNGVYASHLATVRMVEDLGIEAHIDPDALDVVFACDGQRPLRELVAEVAAAQDLDQGTLANTAVDALRELLVSGLVSVVER